LMVGSSYPLLNQNIHSQLPRPAAPNETFSFLIPPDS
jgi:hypothetical protein